MNAEQGLWVTVMCLAVAVVAVHPAAAAEAVRVDSHVSHWVTFDAPGAGPQGTAGFAINDLGEIIGSYNDASPQQLQHGLLRTADGVVVSFDPPGSQFTSPQGINNEGTIVGYYFDAGGTAHGFLRSRQGKFTTIDDPDASGYTEIRAINDLGAVAGFYLDASGTPHGFLQESNGSSLTTIDGPGAVGTTCGHVNIEGEVACQYFDAAGTFHALLRYPGGTLVTFDATGAGTASDTGTFIGFEQALNLEGQITGEYADANNGYHGYLRRADGGQVEFTVPGGGTNNANGTYPASLNLWGTISGFSFDPNGFPSGFVRFADGTLDVFQAPVPANQGTFPFAINFWGQFTGQFFDATGTSHGFAAVATR